MFEKTKVLINAARLLPISNVLNPAKHEKRIEAFGESIGNLLDSWWDED
ncbi:MAG: hypothetical protein LN417_04185 [Candidatus Thermoplasmatota archaeon]|nr:hypothetical protein [Candidatus Thermoplasmatota archaeon]